MKGTVFSTVFLLAVAALLMSMFLAISYGAKEITLSTVWTTLINYDPSDTSHQIIHELRLPRVLGAALIGAAFAVAGALMQGVTRNPLADAGILGVNAGATFVVALSFAFFPNLPYSWLMVVSFLGAVMSTVFIFLLGSSTPGGLTPLRLTVAGSVVAALLHSLSSGIAIYFELSQDLAFWYAGGLAGIKWMHLQWLTPVILLTFLWTPLLGRSISAMALGNDVASNLGIKTKRVQVIAILVSVILAGVSVSAVGSIGFVGLVIPHMARKLVGVDYRLIVPLSAVMGAVLLVLADLGARMVNPPKELAISVMVAMVGVPFFLYLARRERGSY
ncbi:iron ABC transporter permease [Brevibacillus nitrificans]|uniref:Iron ABC transporter permease n=1 Tax=Brevibacillus nitrificans TaxID=651560 RepID=A0A3M8CX03_9BACL|nr:iron ABC transporter permease [Brevibacillus nitrificans]RNB79891.1 iron ABC transporter permease [Brevibacillus nitrificans]